MGKFLTISIATIVLMAIGLRQIMIPLPATVEHAMVRGSLDGLNKLILRKLLALDRSGYMSVEVPSTFRNVLNGLFTRTSPMVTYFKDPAVSCEEEVIADTPVLIFKPKSQDTSNSPAVIYFHGGGFVLLNVWSHYTFTQTLSLEGGVTLFSVDYQLAPEFPYPRGLDDCIRVAESIIVQAEKFGIDSSKIFLAGDSAGGNLATAVSLELSKRYKLGGAILISPWLQIVNFTLPSYQLYGYIFPVQLDWFAFSYAGLTSYESDIEKALQSNGHISTEFKNLVAKYFDVSALPEDLKLSDMTMAKEQPEPFNGGENKVAVRAIQKLTMNKRAWPFLADDADLKRLTKFPILIQYDEFDALRDEAILFANRLRSLGVNVHTSYLKGAVHDETVGIPIYRFLSATEASNQGTRDILDFLHENM